MFQCLQLSVLMDGCLLARVISSIRWYVCSSQELQLFHLFELLSPFTLSVVYLVEAFTPKGLSQCYKMSPEVKTR